MTIGMTVMIEAETGLERGHFPEIMTIIELEIQGKVDPDQGPKLAQIGIEFVVINVGNMITLQGTVQLLKEEKEIEELQQMLNLGNEQLITHPMSNTQAELSRVSSEENLRANLLNL